MTSQTLAAPTPAPLHRLAGTGSHFWGPGDLYTFLVTGEETGGALFAMEALVPPGGGPPPHIHRREDETFYVLEGSCSFRLGERVVVAEQGDYVFVPRGTVHAFRNEGTGTARLLLTFTPAGMEHFFLETLDPAPDPTLPIPDNVPGVGARYAAAAPRHGLEFP